MEEWRIIVRLWYEGMFHTSDQANLVGFAEVVFLEVAVHVAVEAVHPIPVNIRTVNAQRIHFMKLIRTSMNCNQHSPYPNR